MSGRIYRGTFISMICLSIGLLTGCFSNHTRGNTEPRHIALVGGTLIDGRGGEPILDTIILINGDRIEKVNVSGELDIPGNTRIVDVSGSTILPGFINTHVHHGFSEENLKAWAAGGVTTV
ncbi:MAG: hypothetical protein WCF08_11045 [Anaerolineaceae bacterium]